MMIHNIDYTPDTGSVAFDLGHELFKREPELLGVEVWHRAVKTTDKTQDQFDFVTGYMTARLQRDDYEREKNGTSY